MFYRTRISDYIRVLPELFGLDLEDAILKQAKTKFEGYISKDLGIVIDVCGVETVKEGIIIPGDGAPYYEAEFDLLTFKPEMQEIVLGKIKDIADFGAFITIGPIDGMVHISQTMDDYVSFGKDKVLLGKDSKRSLKVGDLCRARIIATSYKDPMNPKLGLTMRQPFLGKTDWEEKPAVEKKAKEGKDTKEEKKEK